MHHRATIAGDIYYVGKRSPLFTLMDLDDGFLCTSPELDTQISRNNERAQ